MSLRPFLGLSLVAILAAQVAPLHAQQKNELFRGKEISLLIGATAGGGADTYGRLLARHYGQYLQGNPTIIAKNVPGAGGLRLANQVYNVSPKDGTEIATFATTTAMEPMFGNKEAKYDTVKFTWIGNMDSDSTGCLTWKTTGIKTWQDMKNHAETTFGASGPSSASSIDAKIMGAILGVNARVIHGYQGTRTSNLAMQRGELDGICGLYMSTIRSQFSQDVENGNLTVWMTFGKERTKEFPDAPTIYEAVSNENDRELATLMFGQDTIGRPFSAPPSLSPEVVTALQSGFMAAMDDKDLQAEATKMGLSIKPMSGTETQQQYQAFYSLPKAVVEHAMQILGGRGGE
jgi:tripartite-type tricarboxylate transporter receptor subunit TctC